MATLRIQLLGDFCLTCGEAEVATIDTPRQQSLLAYLLLNCQARQPRHHVAFVFWPDATEPQARANLRKHLYDLRQDLPDADRFLRVTGNTVQWQPAAPFTLDVAEFESEITTARQAEQAGDYTPMQAALERAVEPYRGDLLLSCYDDWVLPERERLSQMHIRALDRLTQRLAGQREYAAAIRYAQRLLRHDSLHETAYRRLMRLHALGGDRASALRVYRTCTEVLEQELGVEPSPATREVYAHLVSRTPTRRSGAARSNTCSAARPATSATGLRWWSCCGQCWGSWPMKIQIPDEFCNAGARCCKKRRGYVDNCEDSFEFPVTLAVDCRPRPTYADCHPL